MPKGYYIASLTSLKFKSKFTPIRFLNNQKNSQSTFIVCISCSPIPDGKVDIVIFALAKYVSLKMLVFTCKQVKFKVVGRHNARLSPLMKDVLEMRKPRCEMQLFQMFLPMR